MDEPDSSDEPRVVHAPIDKLGIVGLWIRRQLLAQILNGCPVLELIQKHRTPGMTRVMKFFTFLGTEDFYVLLVISHVWIFDARLGRLLVLLMAAAFYFAGAVKNFLVLPRPPSPPIIPLKSDTDWGLPSHHALLGVNMPWYLWFYMYQNYQLEPIVAVVLFTIVASWSFCVMFSRLYLGVHSPADVVAGGILGCLLLAFWLQVDNLVDYYITTPNGCYVVLAAVIILMLIHPDPHPLTITYDDTMAMAGITVGVSFGRRFAPHRIMYAVLDKYSFTSLDLLTFGYLSCARLVIGLVTYLVLKQVLYHLIHLLMATVSQILGISTVCVKRRLLVTKNNPYYNSNFRLPDEKTETTEKTLNLSQPFNLGSQNKPINLDTPVKFVVYSGLGWCAIHWLPMFFNQIGI